MYFAPLEQLGGGGAQTSSVSSAALKSCAPGVFVDSMIGAPRGAVAETVAAMSVPHAHTAMPLRSMHVPLQSTFAHASGNTSPPARRSTTGVRGTHVTDGLPSRSMNCCATVFSAH